MGKLAIRETDGLTTGHICAATTTLDTPGQGDVYIEGLLVSRKGDPTVSHPFPPSPPCAPHVATVGHGSPTVYVHGEKVGYITGPADAGAMTGSNGTVYVATNVEAISQIFDIEIFEPNINTAEYPTIEAFATEVVEGREAEEEAGVNPDLNEGLEYGDGGIGPSNGYTAETQYSNVSPASGESGPQQTPAPDPNDGNENPDASGTPGLNFLPHTDPRIKDELRQILESVASTLGVTLVITSAYRSPEYNASLQGAARLSQHQYGNACDIVQQGWSISDRQNFINVCYAAGIRGFGIYDDFTHVDIGPKRAWGKPNSRRHLYKYPWAQAVLGPLGYATS